MKILIVYASIHHENTRNVAVEIGKILNAKVVSFTNINTQDIYDADIVGFGSGIYWGIFHKGILNLVNSLGDVKKKKCFVFSTAGMKKNFLVNRGHRHIKNLLSMKNFEIIGEYDCLGYDTNGFLKNIGGINKGRPNRNDLDSARKFAKKIKVMI